MADTHDPHGGHDGGHHSDKLFKIYMAVAIALSVFTATSFLINAQVRAGHMTATMGFMLILGVAIVKATLVGMYFMHLTFDWGKLYFMLIPAFILAVMMMIVLLPDIVVFWHGPDVTRP
jgi:cytochrome c oxidase subunit 4